MLSQGVTLGASGARGSGLEELPIPAEGQCPFVPESRTSSPEPRTPSPERSEARVPPSNNQTCASRGSARCRPSPPASPGAAPTSWPDSRRHTRLTSSSTSGTFRRRGQATVLRSAHEFAPRQLQRPYDLIVYQLGNSSHHDYQWPYLFRYPGLVVLHDAHLHHARAACLLRTLRAGDYRAEFAWNHPQAPPAAAELAVAGFDSHLHYAWPMTRLVVARASAVAVHSPGAAERLRDESPSAAIRYRSARARDARLRRRSPGDSAPRPAPALASARTRSFSAASAD